MVQIGPDALSNDKVIKLHVAGGGGGSVRERRVISQWDWWGGNIPQSHNKATQ